MSRVVVTTEWFAFCVYDLLASSGSGSKQRVTGKPAARYPSIVDI